MSAEKEIAAEQPSIDQKEKTDVESKNVPPPKLNSETQVSEPKAAVQNGSPKRDSASERGDKTEAVKQQKRGNMITCENTVTQTHNDKTKSRPGYGPRRSPTDIPKQGKFYMHDTRSTESGPGEPDDDRSTVNGKPARRGRADRKWEHDLYVEDRQKPKSTKELIKKYGNKIKPILQPSSSSKNKQATAQVTQVKPAAPRPKPSHLLSVKSGNRKPENRLVTRAGRRTRDDDDESEDGDAKEVVDKEDSEEEDDEVEEEEDDDDEDEQEDEEEEEEEEEEEYTSEESDEEERDNRRSARHNVQLHAKQVRSSGHVSQRRPEEDRLQKSTRGRPNQPGDRRPLGRNNDKNNNSFNNKARSSPAGLKEVRQMPQRQSPQYQRRGRFPRGGQSSRSKGRFGAARNGPRHMGSRDEDGSRAQRQPQRPQHQQHPQSAPQQQPQAAQQQPPRRGGKRYSAMREINHQNGGGSQPAPPMNIPRRGRGSPATVQFQSHCYRGNEASNNYRQYPQRAQLPQQNNVLPSQHTSQPASYAKPLQQQCPPMVMQNVQHSYLPPPVSALA